MKDLNTVNTEFNSMQFISESDQPLQGHYHPLKMSPRNLSTPKSSWFEQYATLQQLGYGYGLDQGNG